MKNKLILLVVAGLMITVAATPAPSIAACNDGTSQARADEDGNPDTPPTVTGEDTLAELPDGGVIYGDGAEENLNPGYLGIVGPRGYIEVSGNADDAPNVQIDGTTAGGELEGRAGVDAGNSEAPVDACINGTEII